MGSCLGRAVLGGVWEETERGGLRLPEPHQAPVDPFAGAGTALGQGKPLLPRQGRSRFILASFLAPLVVVGACHVAP